MNNIRDIIDKVVPRSSRTNTISLDSAERIKKRFPKTGALYSRANLQEYMSLPLFYAIIRGMPAGYDKVERVELALAELEIEDSAGDSYSTFVSNLRHILTPCLKRYLQVGWDNERNVEIRVLPADEGSPVERLFKVLKELRVVDENGFPVEDKDA